MTTTTSDVPFFYVSSRGGSASTWLSRSLSKHPRVVAMHGTRAVPDFAIGGNYHHVPPKEFFKYLIECAGTTQGEKYFGAIHLYYGAKAKRAADELGGIFSAIIRDPIRRINSLYWSNAQRSMGGRGAHINDVEQFMQSMPESAFECPPLPRIEPLIYKYEEKESAENAGLLETFKAPLRRIKYTYLTNSTPRPSPGEATNNDIAASMAEKFVNYSTSILWSDLECHRATKKEGRMIKMEEMVASGEYFRNSVWPNIAPHLDCSDEFLNSVFTSGVFNKHSYQKDETNGIFAKWPESYRQVVQQAFDLLGRDEMESMYESFGYHLPWK